MECRAWLERVEVELRRRKLPQKLRARLLAELADHAVDIADAGFFTHRTKEGSTMTTDSMIEAKLGTPAELAELAESEARRGGWVRRHPLLVFGLAPLPMAVLALVFAEVPAFILVCVSTRTLPYWAAVWAVAAFAPTLPVVSPVLAALWLGRLARRGGVSRAWLAVGAGQLAVVAGVLVTLLVIGDRPGESFLGLALGWPVPGLPDWATPADGPGMEPRWVQAPQFAAPLLAAWWGGRKKG